jgi:hypothetical protein
MKTRKRNAFIGILVIIALMAAIGLSLAGCDLDVKCTECNGETRCVRCEGTGTSIMYGTRCERCQGTGICQRCGGTGKEPLGESKLPWE